MNRAIYLLHYVVYRNINFSESQVILSKILINMPMLELVKPYLKLTIEEKETADSLLKGLIHNWEKIKNSSPEGIRETFLQRQAILNIDKDKITLKVEQKGIDVLLKSISWDISIIKLPWMTRPIFVEWC